MYEQEKEQPTPGLTPELQLLQTLESVRQNDRGEPLTWGATPLVMTPEITLQQFAVQEVLQDLFSEENTPNYISSELAEYIHIINMARTAQRDARNTDSYIYRGAEGLGRLPLENLDILERTIKGSGSPAELLYIASVLEIPTIELGSLTHPYGQRIEELKNMRPAVNEAIVIMGGTLVTARNQEYEVKGSDNPHDTSHAEGLHMTRKTIFGYLPDGTDVMERSSFILRIDQLPRDMKIAIREIPYKNNTTWSQQVREVEGLCDYVHELLDGDAYEIAIPVSTTVVARNRQLEEKLLNPDATKARRIKYLALLASKI